MALLSKINTTTIPKHIGIIMDGNSRWAKARGKAQTAGHIEGLNAAKRVVKAAADLGIKYITLYTFSTENWRRTEEEVKFLMRLIAKHLRKEWSFYFDNKIRVRHNGDLERLPDYVRKEILDVTEKTAHFQDTTVMLAINYGGRDEIVRAVKKMVARGYVNGSINEETIKDYLDIPDVPDPDLIIRTGGYQRLSNFLIWQCAYAELFFSETYWPDYNQEDLYGAILDYQTRKRNFGGR